ncbi:hypothetical protein A5679_16385 [Mycobacterium scrofulaceum]|uniref:Uncharacterized protein n=2 Tax=Mycobacterium scrofulaceum TaxID=1783 RepID=A0A1A2VRZ0_MYCSC|nr:hypothetical protein A5679_16385 [Mycobacterium scrofulaceum]
MTTEELGDWLRLQVASWWRHVTLMDLYDAYQTTGGLCPQRGRMVTDGGQSPETLQTRALGQILPGAATTSDFSLIN